MSDKTLREAAEKVCETCGAPAEHKLLVHCPECQHVVTTHREVPYYRAALADSADASCETCGGTGELEHVDPRRLTLEGDHPVEEVSPCPDCSADAPEGPWNTEKATSVAGIRWAVINKSESRELWPITNKAEAIAVRDALNHLDAQEEK